MNQYFLSLLLKEKQVDSPFKRGLDYGLSLVPSYYSFSEAKYDIEVERITNYLTFNFNLREGTLSTRFSIDFQKEQVVDLVLLLKRINVPRFNLILRWTLILVSKIEKFLHQERRNEHFFSQSNF
jgi:hypothetical protein